MTMRVPVRPPNLLPWDNEQDDNNDVRIATPVRGRSQWVEYARAVNWLRGRGLQMYACGPINNAPTAGNSNDIHVYCWPQGRNRKFLWALSLVTYAETDSSSGTIQFNGGDTYDWSVPEREGAWTLLFSDDASTTDNTLVVTFTTDAGVATPNITGLTAWQLPVAYHENTATYPGVRETTCDRLAPIKQTANEKESAHGVFAEMTAASTDVTRACVFSWFDFDGEVFTSTSYVDLFLIPPALQTRHMRDPTVVSETVRSVAIAVRAKCTGGDLTGQVLFTMANGDTATISVSGSSSAWYTHTIDVDTDDFTRPQDLIRDGSRDTCTVSVRVTGTTTSVTVRAVCIGES